jgi:hypothetical protein
VAIRITRHAAGVHARRQLRGKLTIARNDNGAGSVFSVDFAADDAA